MPSTRKVPLLNRFLHLAAGAAALTVVSFSVPAVTGWDAWSQATRTVKIVVPYPAGGPTDTMARLLAEQISRAQPLTMVVENRPGAGGTIGTEAVARATPDGNTLLVTAPAFVINPHLRKLNYDPVTSFEPVCHMVRSPQVIVVNSPSSYQTLNDLLSAARAKPGELTHASVGPGTTQHIGFERLKRAANVNMNYVPYPGDAPTVNAILGGHVTSVFINYAPVAEHLKAGKLRALATASRMRIEPLPDVPTVAESGYQDYEAEGGFGVVAPANTPKEMVSQLAVLLIGAMQVPEVKARLVGLGLYPVGVCGSDFAAHIRKEYDDYGRIIRESNIKGE